MATLSLWRADAPPQTMTATPTFGELFDAHAGFVTRTVRYLGTREADVRDLTQEVFLIAYDKRDELVRPDGVRSWLYKIAHGVVRNHQRRAHVRREVPTEEPPAPDAGAEPVDPVERSQSRARLLHALNAIDDDKRAVLVAHAIEEMPMKEIARALGIPLKTAYGRLYAAKREAASALARLDVRQKSQRSAR